MYYRITTLKFNPTQRADFYAQADQARSQMQALEGIQVIHTVETAEGEVDVLARYETEDQANAAAPQVREILGGMAAFFIAPPVMKQGAVTWSM